MGYVSTISTAWPTRGVIAASCVAEWTPWHLGGTCRSCVEKILGEGETLREDWCVDGTTGYEFMDQLSLLQHQPDGFAPLAELWTRHTERPSAFIEEARLGPPADPQRLVGRGL